MMAAGRVATRDEHSGRPRRIGCIDTRPERSARESIGSTRICLATGAIGAVAARRGSLAALAQSCAA